MRTVVRRVRVLGSHLTAVSNSAATHVKGQLHGCYKYGRGTGATTPRIVRRHPVSHICVGAYLDLCMRTNKMYICTTRALGSHISRTGCQPCDLRCCHRESCARTHEASLPVSHWRRTWNQQNIRTGRQGDKGRGGDGGATGPNKVEYTDAQAQYAARAQMHTQIYTRDTQTIMHLPLPPSTPTPPRTHEAATYSTALVRWAHTRSISGAWSPCSTVMLSHPSVTGSADWNVRGAPPSTGVAADASRSRYRAAPPGPSLLKRRVL